MGQYHLICNLDKKQYLHPHRFGDGLKLMEFGCSGSGTLTALTVLLAASNGRGGGDFYPSDDATPEQIDLIGSWSGDRISIIGDYWAEDDIPGLTDDPGGDDEVDIPWNTDHTWEEMSERLLPLIKHEMRG